MSGGIYIPIEMYELIQRITWIRVGALVLNVVIVAYMAWLLTESRRKRAATEKKLTAGG